MTRRPRMRHPYDEPRLEGCWCGCGAQGIVIIQHATPEMEEVLQEVLRDRRFREAWEGHLLEQLAPPAGTA